MATEKQASENACTNDRDAQIIRYFSNTFKSTFLIAAYNVAVAEMFLHSHIVEVSS
jgi:hypothetical protein